MVCFTPHQSRSSAKQADAPQAEVLYADSSLAVVNKPPGLTVHPADSEKGPTLVHFLIRRFPGLERLDPERPGIVHRLDKDTSGLLLVALQKRSGRRLSADFAARRVDKEYLCICQGVPDTDFRAVCHHIGRHPRIKTKMTVLRDGQGREARTELYTVYKGRDWSLLRVRIRTGRTHQIRVHLAHEGLPVLGDAVYGPAGFDSPRIKKKLFSRLVPRQLLHAWRLKLIHPETGEDLQFSVPPPRDFLRALLLLDKKPQRVLVVGSPGSGKSEVLSLLAQTGAETWSADSEVSRLYCKGAPGFDMLRMSFGESFISEESGEVDKKALFMAMLGSDHVRREVEHLIHPLVRGALERFWSGANGLVRAAEVPLFFEAGMDKEVKYDVCVGVFAPERIRFSRLRERGWSREMTEKVESWQLPQEKKLVDCDLLVDNSGSPKELEERVDALSRVLCSLRRREMKRLSRLWTDFFRTGEQGRLEGT